MINKEDVHERLEVIDARIKDAQSVVLLIKELLRKGDKDSEDQESN